MMKTIVALMILLLTSPVLAAAPVVHRDLPYAGTKDAKQTLDIYSPAEGKNHPIVFWIHGGGWQHGDKSEVDQKPPAFVDKGFVFVSVGYRLFPAVSTKTIAEDVAKAFRWTHDHAAEFGGDPNTIFVMGHSAGAQLSALICTDERYLKAEGLSLSNVKGCIPVDGDTYDLPMQIATVEKKRKDTFRREFGDEQSQRGLSSALHVAPGKHIPPFLLIHVANHPETKAQAQRLAKALEEAGVSAKLFGAEDTNHVKLNADMGPPDDKATQAVWEFVDGVLEKTMAAGWVDVTHNVGGEKWGGYGVHYMSAVPGSAAVIAGVSESGLWKTSDEGATWKKLGGNEIKNRPDRIVYDPKNPAIFWVSGCYGNSPFRTDDGGKTFQRLGNLSHSDGIAIDFTDPQRRTLLLGLHEQSQSLMLSIDKGRRWTKIGARLPDDSNHSSDPVIINSKTFLINTAGWKQKASLGIYRSEDAGQTWTEVSKFGPTGQALVASDGAIYWQRIWGGGLLKSTDEGKTWKAISKTIKDNPIELPGNRLAGVNGNQIQISSDGGETWAPVGPKIPFKPNGIVFSAKGNAFYAWRMADNMKRPPISIARLSMK